MYYKPFPRSTSVRSNISTRARLGWTFSYICFIFVHPDLELAPLFVCRNAGKVYSTSEKFRNYRSFSLLRSKRQIENRPLEKAKKLCRYRRSIKKDNYPSFRPERSPKLQIFVEMFHRNLQSPV